MARLCRLEQYIQTFVLIKLPLPVHVAWYIVSACREWHWPWCAPNHEAGYCRVICFLLQCVKRNQEVTWFKTCTKKSEHKFITSTMLSIHCWLLCSRMIQDVIMVMTVYFMHVPLVVPFTFMCSRLVLMIVCTRRISHEMERVRPLNWRFQAI